MKKILSAVLATAMIASMSAVAFAAQPTPVGAAVTFGTTTGLNLKEYTSIEDPFTVKVDDGKPYYPVVALKGAFGYDTEDKALYNNTAYPAAAGNGYAAPVQYGETAYYALVQFIPTTKTDGTGAFTTANDADDGMEIKATTKGNYTLVTESETVSSIKIKQEWEEGKDLVKSVSIVKKKVANVKDIADNTTANAIEYSGDDSDDPKLYYPAAEDLGLDKLGYKKDTYYYFLAIAYEDSTSTSDSDVVGTLTLSKSKDPSIDKMEIDIENNVDWENSWRSSITSVADTCEVTGDIDLKADKNYALKFECDDEVEITFDDDSTFTVDVSGQSKILFNYSTDYISKIAAKYPMAELNFWNGNGAKFNRVGEMFLSCEDLTGHQFLYQVTSDGKLAEVPGAEWDDSDEGFYFNTRVLGSYVISDMELPIAEEKPADNTSTVITTPITNPSTGAIA